LHRCNGFELLVQCGDIVSGAVQQQNARPSGLRDDAFHRRQIAKALAFDRELLFYTERQHVIL
jgi:hypothetical protein